MVGGRNKRGENMNLSQWSPGDWGAVVSILVVMFGVVNYLMKSQAKEATQDDIKHLTTELTNFRFGIKELRSVVNDLKKTAQRLDKVEDQLVEFEKRLIILEEHDK